MVVQKGKEVWNYITRDMAIIVASRLYNKEENNVVSKLCSSYGWDTALKFMQEQEDNIISNYPINSIGGYYGQSGITVTGNDTTCPCNIYDMGGNFQEWTTETTISNLICVYRGGYYGTSDLKGFPAAIREAKGPEFASHNTSFRVTLYM